MKQEENEFSPRDFMRSRRPELYSDSMVPVEPIITKSQLEYHLDTLTQRKEEIRFEQFCRKLAQKEICPNLSPQTGPTGGGDSQVDGETYPVSTEIAERWYVGEPEAASKERWAFAFSAKKIWRPKVQSDVEKIAKTLRGYTRIYFISNQGIRDRDRAEVEDRLKLKFKTDVRILDRSWIVERVQENNRWDVVFQTLDIESPRDVAKAINGPLDAERLRDLEALDKRLDDTPSNFGDYYQLTEDALETALLARGLGRPRSEIDGRFARAMRLARKYSDSRQLFRIIYQQAWTAHWWFDDFAELARLYKDAEAIAIGGQWIWDLEKLVNLWQVGNFWRRTQGTLQSDIDWVESTRKLRADLLRHATENDKPTSALWARTHLILLDLTDAVGDRTKLPEVIQNLRGVLTEADGLLEYPLEPIVKIIEELSGLISDDEALDQLVEYAIQIHAKRAGEVEEGWMRLDHGMKRLHAQKYYDAISHLGKVQSLLAKEAQMDGFLRAAAGLALAYEGAGLLWAARTSLVATLDRCLYAHAKEGRVLPQSVPLLRKLLWVEVQLGRVPCVLGWLWWLRLLAPTLLNDDAQREIRKEIGHLDAVLGIVVLRTRYVDWLKLDRAADLLEKSGLPLSRGAALFALGHENMFRDEYGMQSEDLTEFFSKWLDQPAANDLPDEAEWHAGDHVSMRTVVLGCQVEVVAVNKFLSILLGEALLAFIEAFFSTLIKKTRIHAARSILRIEIQETDGAAPPFTINSVEDDCGETGLLISHPPMSAAALVAHDGYQAAFALFLAKFASELHTAEIVQVLREAFEFDRAQDRSFFLAQAPLFTSNVFDENGKYHLDNLLDDTHMERLDRLRERPPNLKATPVEEATGREFGKISLGQPPEELLGVDGIKHRDLGVFSPINLPLWDKAGWSGVGFVEGGGYRTRR